MHKDEFHFDKRIIARNLAKKVVTPEQYASYLKGLKDLSGEYGIFEASLMATVRRVQRRSLENEEEEL